jgi:hypothetical protein
MAVISVRGDLVASGCEFCVFGHVLLNEAKNVDDHDQAKADGEKAQQTDIRGEEFRPCHVLFS